MITYQATAASDPLNLNPDRNDWVGATLSAVLPLAVLGSVHGLVSASGASVPMLSPDLLPFALPQWVLVAAWSALFATWGLARWAVVQHGESGAKAGNWVLGLIGVALVFPYALGMLDAFWSTFAVVFGMLFVIVVAGKVADVSKPAALWMVPSLLWLGMTSLVSFAIFAGGWSPPFAVTDPLEAAPAQA